MAKWIRRVIFVMGALLVLLLGLGFSLLHFSKPVLQGRLTLSGLENTVSIDRDGKGIPSIFADTQADAYFAAGFLHAQDRFFQMDLYRRTAAGELSGLVPGTINLDRRYRRFQFRKRAGAMFQNLSNPAQELLQAYSRGVNQGLRELTVRPFEYLLLRAKPEPWTPEDCLLVAYSMYLDLEGGEGRQERSLALLHATLSPSAFRFLCKNGNTWDAPLDNSSVPILPIPLESQWSLPEPDSFTSSTPTWEAESAPTLPGIPRTGMERPVLGSNSWAIRGSQTHDGRPILANDPHLGLRLPLIWYRVDFHYPDERGRPCREVGATIPGIPLIIIGTNTFVSWSMTTQNADTEDLVRIIPDPERPDHYLTPEGSFPFRFEEEIIQPRKGVRERVRVKHTRFGPVVGKDVEGYDFALLWSGFAETNFNLELSRFHQVRTVDELLNLANRVNMPVQNIIAADREGNIGWSCIGWLPERSGYDGFLPVDSNDPSWAWNGRLPPERYPRILNPSSNRLWTANNRVLGGSRAMVLGDGQPSFSSRAWVIRENLKQATGSSELDMLALQGNIEGVMLNRWKTLLENVVRESESPSADARVLLEYLGNWTGRATVDSVDYRIVREFRLRVRERVLGRLLAPLKTLDPGFRIHHFRYEEPLWLIVSQQPDYLADPELGSWQAELEAILDALLGFANQQTAGQLNQYTYGQSNRLVMAHPISFAVPYLGRFLNMPEVPTEGDSLCINAMRIDYGPSFRFVSSPGQESEAIFQMPAGQSGHPLSPHYRDQHEGWINNDPAPLLPGPALHTLMLSPK